GRVVRDTDRDAHDHRGARRALLCRRARGALLPLGPGPLPELESASAGPRARPARARGLDRGRARRDAADRGARVRGLVTPPWRPADPGRDTPRTSGPRPPDPRRAPAP